MCCSWSCCYIILYVNAFLLCESQTKWHKKSPNGLNKKCYILPIIKPIVLLNAEKSKISIFTGDKGMKKIKKSKRKSKKIVVAVRVSGYEVPVTDHCLLTTNHQSPPAPGRSVHLPNAP